MPLNDDMLKAHLQIMVNHYPQYITIKNTGNVAAIATGSSDNIMYELTGEDDNSDIVFIVPCSAISSTPITGDPITYKNDDYRVMSVKTDPAGAAYRLSCKLKV